MLINSIKISNLYSFDDVTYLFEKYNIITDLNNFISFRLHFQKMGNHH